MSSKSKSKPKKEPEVVAAPYRPKIFVVGGGYFYIKLLYSFNCDGAKGVDDADIVLFTGGEDVNPALYGESPLKNVFFNKYRDDHEIAVYEAAKKRGLPMVGICRGAQFLNVMNGGKLWQNVDNHTKNHLARVEIPPFNGNKRRVIEVTSTHHQMMRPTKDAVVLLTACEAETKDAEGLTKLGKDWDNPDIEAVWYAETQCLCFQPHPEYNFAPPECVDFFQECLENFIFPVANQHPKGPGTKGRLLV